MQFRQPARLASAALAACSEPKKSAEQRLPDSSASHPSSFMIGPPTFFVSLMAAPGFSSERVASLRLVSSGGAGVTEAFVLSGSYELDVAMRRVPCSVVMKPLYDPKMLRVRG